MHTERHHLGAKTPYWRLSWTYFFSYAVIGGMVPYWPLYLESKSLSPEWIGFLMSLAVAGRIAIPYFVSWTADQKNSHIRMLRLLAFLALLCFWRLTLAHEVMHIAIQMLLYGALWGSVLPLIEVLTMEHLRQQVRRYSRIRLWGSIGFIAATVGLGQYIEQASIAVLAPALLAINALMWFSTLWVPAAKPVAARQNEGSILEVLKRKEVLALLIVCLLVLISHGPYYTFFSVYLEEHQYSRSMIGYLWALGVVAEVIVFMMTPIWIERMGARRLLLVSALLTSIRWLLIGFFVDYAWVIGIAQCLHAASYAAFHAAAITMVIQYFRGGHVARGQALYGSVSFGLGGTIGSMASGVLWAQLGATFTFVLAALIAGIAWLIALGWVYKAPMGIKEHDLYQAK